MNTFTSRRPKRVKRIAWRQTAPVPSRRRRDHFVRINGCSRRIWRKLGEVQMYALVFSQLSKVSTVSSTLLLGVFIIVGRGRRGHGPQ